MANESPQSRLSRTSAALILLTALCCLSSCSAARNNNSSATTGDEDCEDTTMAMAVEKISFKDSETLIEPLIQFTSNLFAKIRQDERNVILSPISVHAALNLVALGAEANSVTEQELKKGLGYSAEASQQQLDDYHKAYKNAIQKFRQISKVGMEALRRAQAEQKNPEEREPDGEIKPPVVDFYNTLIIKQNKPLLGQYSKRAADFYNATVEQAGPETVSKICDKVNKWGKDAGFESDILTSKEISRDDFTTMLLSAVHVQAFWFNEFNEFTDKNAFHNYGLKEKLVSGKLLGKSKLQLKVVEFCAESEAEFKMLFARKKEELGDQLKELASLNCSAVEVRLQGKVSLTIVVPKSSGKGTELGELMRKLLDGNKLQRVLSSLDKSKREHVDYFSFPKFSFQSDIDLKGPLKSLGMNRIFDTSSSDLRRILQNEPVCVDSVKHQAMIEVNKYGLKAAGVTKIQMTALMAMTRPERIEIDVKNPFIFIIRYEQFPLFVGQLVKLDK